MRFFLDSRTESPYTVVMDTAGLMDVREAAEYLGMHASTLYGMVRDGKVPHFRIGTRIRFSKEAIDEWVRSDCFRPVNGLKVSQDSEDA